MVLNIDPYNLNVFCFWGGILLLKILAMAPLTSFHRFRKRVFSNPEDTIFLENSRVAFDDSDVERVRRAHLNDLESILPWFLATLLWLTTGPSTLLAGWLIRIYVVLRILHTIVYAVFPLPQPSRAIVFLLGNLITGYMAAATIVNYFYY